VSRGSAAEVAYLITLASELGYLSVAAQERLRAKCDRLVPQLERLVQRIGLLVKTENERRGEA
jgi:four helix bundle protein